MTPLEWFGVLFACAIALSGAPNVVFAATLWLILEYGIGGACILIIYTIIAFVVDFELIT